MLPFHLPEQLLSPTESNSSSNPTTWHHLSWTFRSAPPGPVCSLLFNCPERVLLPFWSPRIRHDAWEQSNARCASTPLVPSPLLPQSTTHHPQGLTPQLFTNRRPHTTPKGKHHATLWAISWSNKYKSNHSCRDYSALGSKAKTNPSDFHFSVTAQITASCSSSSPHESSSLPGSAFLPAVWDPHSRKHGACAAGWVAPVWAGAPAPTSSSSKINIGAVLGL